MHARREELGAAVGTTLGHREDEREGLQDARDRQDDGQHDRRPQQGSVIRTKRRPGSAPSMAAAS
jgi:hypothetical protein